MLADHPRVADDVLDHDDRVVHQDADREDQREERDAVQGVAEEIEQEERERQRDRNRDQHHGRLAPAEDQPDQRRDREDGEQHVPQQLVALVGGRLAVVAGDGELHVRRHQRPLQRVELRRDAPGDVGRVGALPLGDGDGDGRLRAGGLRLEGDVRRRLGVAVDDVRHVAHEHGTPARRGHDGVAQIIGRAQAVPRLEAGHAAARDRARRGAAHVGAGDRLLNGERIEIVGRQPRGVDVHADLPRPPADDRHLRHVVDFGDGVPQLDGQQSQLIVRVPRRPHRDGQDRHVVDRARLDDGTDHARRDAVRVRGELLVEANERGFQGLVHREAGDDHRLSGARGRVDVFHAGHFPEQLLQRTRDPLFDVRRCRPGHLDEDVDHRHDNLRFLFARQRQHRQGAERHRGQR